MWPYWILFLVPAALAVTRLAPAKETCRSSRLPDTWWVALVMLVMMIGLRHEVGGDWSIYLEMFEVYTGSSDADQLPYQDPMYIMLNKLSSWTGLGIYLLNLVSAAFFSWGLVVFCRAQPRPWLALAVAVPYLITVVAMGYTRQGAAIGIAMLAIVALSHGSTMRFMLCIAMAALFHKSAIILVPLAVLAKTKRRAFTYLWVMLTGVVLYILLLQEAMDFLIHGYIQSEYQSSGAAIRIAMNASPAAIFLLFRKRFQLEPAQQTFWTWMAWSALLFIVLLNVSPSSTAVDRVALYWIPLQLFVLSRLPNVLGPKNGRNAFWVCAVVAYSATVHFVWLVFADTSFAWLPYQFYPWVWLWQ
jgi:hypothetical protein